MSAKVLITTSEAATLMGVKVKSLIVARSMNKDGAYRGVIPTKRANGRLLWPRAALLKLRDADVLKGDGRAGINKQELI